MKQESLAQKLQLLRAERGLTLVQASVLTGVTRGTLSELEGGKREAYMPTLSKIAEGYGVDVRELLLEEPVLTSPKVEGPRETGPAYSPGFAGGAPLMDRPEVQEWLKEQGHMSRDEFLSWAEECEDEDDIEQAIAKLRETRNHIVGDPRNHIVGELRKKETQDALFGAPETEGLTGDEWDREVFRPGKAARRLANEVRREYSARELGLVNYNQVLFIEGKADDYLVYGPISERHDERHEQMLEARRRVLEEKYAAAAAVV